MSNIQFTHKLDDSIVYTYEKPNAKQFAAYWNAFVRGGGRDNIGAQANLVIACRKTPDENMLKELLDVEWSGLPAIACPAILESSGLFPFGEKVDSFFGERVKLESIANPKEKDDNALQHIERLASCGVTPDMIRAWYAVRNSSFTRILIALPESIGGYYYGRVPTLSDRITAQQVHNAPPSEQEAGPFDAMVRLMIDCCIMCAPTPVENLARQWPGAAISIGVTMRELGNDSFEVERKKLNP